MANVSQGVVDPLRIRPAIGCEPFSSFRRPLLCEVCRNISIRWGVGMVVTMHELWKHIQGVAAVTSLPSAPPPPPTTAPSPPYYLFLDSRSASLYTYRLSGSFWCHSN